MTQEIQVVPDDGTTQLMTHSELLGYTFWIDDDGNFMSAPTFSDNSVDMDNAIAVTDWESFDELSADELSHLFGYILKISILKRDYVKIGYYSNLFGGTN